MEICLICKVNMVWLNHTWWSVKDCPQKFSWWSLSLNFCCIQILYKIMSHMTQCTHEDSAYNKCQMNEVFCVSTAQTWLVILLHGNRFPFDGNSFHVHCTTYFWTCCQIICTDSNLRLLGCTEWIVWWSKHVKCKLWYYNVAITSSRIIKKQKWKVIFLCMKFKLTFIHCTQGTQNSLCWQCNSNI
jgi:hypothetical protein